MPASPISGLSNNSLPRYSEPESHSPFIYPVYPHNHLATVFRLRVEVSLKKTRRILAATVLLIHTLRKAPEGDKRKEYRGKS